MASRLVFPQSLDYQTDGCELQSANDDKGNGEGFEDEHHCEGWLGDWSKLEGEMGFENDVCIDGVKSGK